MSRKPRKTKKKISNKSSRFSDVFVVPQRVREVDLHSLSYEMLKVAQRRHRRGAPFKNKSVIKVANRYGMREFVVAMNRYLDNVDRDAVRIDRYDSSGLFKYDGVEIDVNNDTTVVKADGNTITHITGVSNADELYKSAAAYRRQLTASRFKAYVQEKVDRDTDEVSVVPRLSKANDHLAGLDLHKVSSSLASYVKDYTGTLEMIESSNKVAVSISRTIAERVPATLREKMYQSKGYCEYSLSHGDLGVMDTSAESKRLITMCLQNNPGSKGLGQFRDMHMDSLPLDRSTRDRFEYATDFQYVEASVYYIRTTDYALARDIFQQIGALNKNKYVLHYESANSYNFQDLQGLVQFDENMMIAEVLTTGMFCSRHVVATTLPYSVVDFATPPPEEGYSQYNIIKTARRHFNNVLKATGKCTGYQCYVSHNMLVAKDIFGGDQYTEFNSKKRERFMKLWNADERYLPSVRARYGVSIYSTVGKYTGDQMLQFLLGVQFHALTYILHGVPRRSYFDIEVPVNKVYNFLVRKSGRRKKGIQNIRIDVGSKNMDITKFNEGVVNWDSDYSDYAEEAVIKGALKAAVSEPEEEKPPGSHVEPPVERKRRVETKGEIREETSESSDGHEAPRKRRVIRHTRKKRGRKKSRIRDYSSSEYTSSEYEDDFSDSSDYGAKVKFEFPTSAGGERSTRGKKYSKK